MLAERIHPELVRFCEIPGTHENLKARSSRIDDVSKQILARRFHALIRTSQDQVTALSQRGDETRFINASKFLRSNQHACIARMYWECEHAPAERGNGCLACNDFECAKIQQ